MEREGEEGEAKPGDGEKGGEGAGEIAADDGEEDTDSDEFASGEDSGRGEAKSRLTDDAPLSMRNTDRSCNSRCWTAEREWNWG